MLKINPIQTNFTSGELSPQLLGRSDTERFFNGGELIENFFVRPQGCILYRPGAKNIGRAKSQVSATSVRLIDFVRSRTDAIAIEISHNTAGTTFRFMRNGAFIQDASVDVLVQYYYGGSVVLPYTSAQIPYLQFAQSADVIYITHSAHPPATLSRYSDTDWRYEVIEFQNGPFSDQTDAQSEISITAGTPVDRLTLTSSTNNAMNAYAEDDYIQYNLRGTKAIGVIKEALTNQSVKIEPKEDFCFVLSKEVYSPGLYTGWDAANNLPQYNTTITGSGVTVAFSATGVVQQGMIGGFINFQDKAGVYYWLKVTGVGDILKQGAYGILATGDILTVLSPAGNITRSDRTIWSELTASSAVFSTTIDPAGRVWRLVLGSSVVYATGRAPIGTEAANSTTVLNTTLSRTLPRSIYGLAVVDDGTTHQWNSGAWYTGNYPAAVGFHQERLCFGGTTTEPQTVWCSKSADFYNFAGTNEALAVLDNSAITFTISSDTVNEILWISSKKVMLIGTVGGEWAAVPGAGNAETLTPSNVTVGLQSSFGSEFTKPVSAANSLIYLQRGGKKLRQMTYDYQVEGQASIDLTVFAEHIMRTHSSGIQVVYQQLPESILYVRLGDGQVAMLAYEPDQKVYAWSRIIAGGDGFIESIASIPESSSHKLYMVVRRTINAATVRTIEYMGTDFTPTSTTDWSSTSFLDNYLETTTTSTVSTLTGLNDYKLKVVWCQIGTVFFTATVSVAGVLAIPTGTATNGLLTRVGFQYAGLYKSFPIETQAQAGSGQGKPKRIDHLNLRIQNTTNFSHGWDSSDLRPEDFRKTTDPVGAPPPMRSEDFRATFDNGIDVRGAFYIKQTEPYPLSVLAIMPEMAQFQ